MRLSVCGHMFAIPLLITAVLLCSAPRALAGESVPHFEKSGTVSISESRTPDGQIRWDSVDRTFYIVRDRELLEKEFTYYLYEQTIKRTMIAGAEGADSHINYKLWGKTGDTYDKLIWEIDSPGDEVEWHQGYVRTPKYGCCGSDDAYYYFHGKTGKPFVESSSDLTVIDLGHQEHRVLSFLTAFSVIPIEEQTAIDSHTGVLQYSNEYYTQSEVLITGALDRAENPEITFIDKAHPEGVSVSDFKVPSWNHDDHNITGFSIKLHFWDGFDLVIPVRGDKLDIDHATMPKGISLSFRELREPDAYLRDIRFVRLEEQKPSTLRLLRNEIYARHGHSFEGADLRHRFSLRSWYKERKDHKVTNDELTHKEQQMLKKILDLEKEKK
jgi:hypothetical protein